MFFVLSKLLDVLLTPLSWSLVLILASIPWRRRYVRRWRRRRGLAIAGVALLLLSSFEPVSNGLLYSLERSETPTYRADETYDVVILLGGVVDERIVFETKQPAYNENVERLVVTHRLLQENKARFAIVSGGPVSRDLHEYSEAVVLKKQIVDWGIDPNRVIVEDAAKNTRENAVFSERIVKERGFEKVLIVTSAFHMRRSVECFLAVGMTFDTLSVDYRAHGGSYGIPDLMPRPHYLAVTSATIREMAGRWIYRVQGYGKAKP